jgi:hypothetical protein
MKFYSKTTNGFYDDSFHDVIPKEAISITDDLYLSLFQGQALGKIIVSDKKGNPILIDRSIVEPVILTTQEKLEKAGLTVDELKSLLGL